jgi:hypothetical protein
MVNHLERAGWWAAGVTAVALLTATTIQAAPAVQSPAQAAALAAQAGLIGTWALVRYEDTDAAGKMTKAFGEHPTGYFVYDATGHVHIQFTSKPPVPAQNANAASAREQGGTLRDYAAYFGTYRIDIANGTVTHVVEGSLRADYLGTEQVRPFKVVGDVLTISMTLPDGSNAIRVLHRVKQ